MDKLEKLLRKIDPAAKRNIEQALIDILAHRIYGYDVKKLASVNGLYRIRIGRYRIVFRMDREGAFIISVSKRDERTYKDL